MDEQKHPNVYAIADDWEAASDALDKLAESRMRKLCKQALAESDDGEVTVTIVLRERKIVKMGWESGFQEVSK